MGRQSFVRLPLAFHNLVRRGLAIGATAIPSNARGVACGQTGNQATLSRLKQPMLREPIDFFYGDERPFP